MLTNTQISNILNALGAPNGVWKDGSWYSFEGADTTNTQAVNYVDILLAVEAPNAFWINGTWSTFTEGSSGTLPGSTNPPMVVKLPASAAASATETVGSLG